MKPIHIYRKAIESAVAPRDATEHTYRHHLKALIESLDDGVEVINEPGRSPDVGAPDMQVKRGATPIGYIETKDVGFHLEGIAEKLQLQRYRRGLPKAIRVELDAREVLRK